MNEPQPNPIAVRAVAWITDLIFETKIRSTAQSLGAALTTVRSIASLTAELDRSPPTLVIVDLNAAGDPIEAVTLAKAHASHPRVVAYVSHVDVDLARRAQSAGADEVMPRSRFTNELPKILGEA